MRGKMKRILWMILLLAVPVLAGTTRLPVKVTCETKGSSSTVKVKFLSAARDVTIATNALDELELQETAPITRTQVAAGETITYEVQHHVGEGPAGLNVSVRGRFNGPRVLVGAYAFILQDEAPAVRSTDSKGREVLVVPTGR